MQTRTMQRICLPLIASVFLLAVGCKFESNRRYTGEMTAGGRTVKASSDKVTSITFDNHNFVISFSAKKCIVERERLLYEGKELARLPAEATSIVIEFFDGNFMVVADGQTVRAASPPH